MSDHCAGCAYDPGARTGDRACPFTTLYWDFLDRHEGRLRPNRRMGFAYTNLERLPPAEREEIRRLARALRDDFTA